MWRCYALPVAPVGRVLPPLGVGRVALRQQGRAAPSPIPVSPRARWLRVLPFPAPLGQSGFVGALRPPFLSATALCCGVRSWRFPPSRSLRGFPALPAPRLPAPCCPFLSAPAMCYAPPVLPRGAPPPEAGSPLPREGGCLPPSPSPRVFFIVVAQPRQLKKPKKK